MVGWVFYSFLNSIFLFLFLLVLVVLIEFKLWLWLECYILGVELDFIMANESYLTFVIRLSIDFCKQYLFLVTEVKNLGVELVVL